MLDRFKTIGWRSWPKLCAVSPTIMSAALSKVAERLGVITCFHPHFFEDASSWLGLAIGFSLPSVSRVSSSPTTGGTFQSYHSFMLKIIGFIFQLSLPYLFLCLCSLLFSFLFHTFFTDVIDQSNKSHCFTLLPMKMQEKHQNLFV